MAWRRRRGRKGVEERAASRIQSVWRGRRCRRAIRNLLIGLPRDVQRKIVFHMREPLLLELHHYSPLRRVICGYVKSVPCVVSSEEEVERVRKALRLMTKYERILPSDESSLRWFRFVTRPSF